MSKGQPQKRHTPEDKKLVMETMCKEKLICADVTECAAVLES